MELILHDATTWVLVAAVAVAWIVAVVAAQLSWRSTVRGLLRLEHAVRMAGQHALADETHERARQAARRLWLIRLDDFERVQLEHKPPVLSVA
jgi:hypothetical protein